MDHHRIEIISSTVIGLDADHETAYLDRPLS